MNVHLAGVIQHTLVAPGLTAGDIERHCAECVEHGFDAAMVPGNWVQLAAGLLAGARPKVASAVDFPLGVMTTTGKVAEAVAIADHGAVELDVGVPVGWLRSGRGGDVRDDLAAVVAAVAPVPVKAMLELPLLSAAERELAVDIAVDAGIRWLKNASGRQVGVATPEDIAFLRRRAPASIGVKASGGIDSVEHALALLAAGADLIGTSSGIAITRGAVAASGDY